MMSRRVFLTAWGASALIVGAAAAGHAILRLPIEHARRPWLAAGDSHGDPRLDALSFAILAPSPHNRQPWLLALEGTHSLGVYCQLDRRLPQTDPFDRQIVIGFGAFLELLRMAALEYGYAVEVEPFPEGTPPARLDARPLARVHFSASSQAPDPLFAQVLRRRTCRTPFADTMPTSSQLDRIFDQPLTGCITDGRRREELRALCIEGWRVEHAYTPTMLESNALTRIGAAEVNATPDGIALHGAMIEAARRVGALTRDAMATTGSWAHRQVEAFYETAIEASPVFGWLLGPGDSQADRLDAGRRWLRLHLAATREGLGLQPLSQVLQEFTPMRPLLARVHDLLATDGGRVHGLFRLGFGEAPGAAPRWSLDSRLVERR